MDAWLGRGDMPWSDDPDDTDDPGSAGVREPRRPKPVGPMSGAGARPVPEPEWAVALPDPRYDVVAG